MVLLLDHGSGNGCNLQVEVGLLNAWCAIIGKKAHIPQFIDNGLDLYGYCCNETLLCYSVGQWARGSSKYGQVSYHSPSHPFAGWLVLRPYWCRRRSHAQKKTNPYLLSGTLLRKHYTDH